jgi:hypothetical protein
MTRKQQRGLARFERPSSAEARAADPITVWADKSIRINGAALETPQQVYDADVAWVKRRLGAVSLFFGKLKLDGPPKLRTRVELRYSPETFVYQFWKNATEFNERVAKYLEKFPPNAERDALKPEALEAEKDHSEWANFDYLAHSGHHASLDFFQLPPRGVALFMQDKGTSALKVVPILRVQTTTDELHRLLNAAGEIVAELAPQLPKPEGE